MNEQYIAFFYTEITAVLEILSTFRNVCNYKMIIGFKFEYGPLHLFISRISESLGSRFLKFSCRFLILPTLLVFFYKIQYVKRFLAFHAVKMIL